jgi:hypothetical protein
VIPEEFVIPVIPEEDCRALGLVSVNLSNRSEPAVRVVVKVLLLVVVVVVGNGVGAEIGAENGAGVGAEVT